MAATEATAAPRPDPVLVVFTDLDGTLLRHEDYDWSAAREAVAELARRGIPVVIASSKTRAEIEAWRFRLGNRDPFISENGGALYVPAGATPRVIPHLEPADGYLCARLGAPYRELRRSLQAFSRELGVELRGFGDMEVDEIAERTGLAGEELHRARAREHDEPFVPARPLGAGEEARLAELARAAGLRVARGGRFHHLMGPTSKGAAARLLLSGYGTAEVPARSLGFGDGANDLELLQAMDRPVVVARPDGTHAPELRAGLPGARLTLAPGPEGFNRAILEYLAKPW